MLLLKHTETHEQLWPTVYICYCLLGAAAIEFFPDAKDSHQDHIRIMRYRSGATFLALVVEDCQFFQGFSSGNPDTPGVGKLPHLFMMGCQWHAIPFSSPCSPIITILLAQSLSEKQVTAAGSKLQSCLCMGRRFHGHPGQTRVAWQVTGVGVESFFAAQVTGWDSMHHPLCSACVGNRCRVFRANRSENFCKQTCYILLLYKD